MRKGLATVVTCGLVIGSSFFCSTMSVEAASAVSIRTANGNYSTMGFGGSFQEMGAKVREHLTEGHDNPIWFIASEKCHSEAEYYFSTDNNRLRSNLEEAFQSDPQKAAKDVLSSDEEEFAVEIDSAQPIYWHTEDVNSDKFLLEVAVGKYVIEQGDCLSVLAERFNTSVEQLMADNQNIIDPDLIYTGDFIVVK